MRNLAPNIVRKRLLIEGYYSIEVDKDVIVDFFNSITNKLSLRMYGEPIVFSPGGDGREENQGYDAFVPLIDSGISLYIWSGPKFFSVIIYTCKDFDSELAIESTKAFFKSTEVEHFTF